MNILRQCLLLMLFAILMIPLTANAEIKTYEGVGRYNAVKGENLDKAKQQAKKLALRDAQEQVYTYVKSYSEADNLKLAHDEIVTITLGIMNVQSTKYEVQTKAAGDYTVVAKVKADVEKNSISDWIKRVKEAEKDSETININAKKKPSVITGETFKSDSKIKDGDVYFNKKDYEKAAAIYTEAIEMDTRNDYAYYSRALAYIKLNKYKEATDDINEAVKRNPYVADYYTTLAEIYIHLKNYNRAIAYSTKAIELDPKLYQAYYNRGVAYYNVEENDNASADFNKALELKPDFLEAKQMLNEIKS